MSASEYCPNCRSLQHMEVTVFEREEVDAEGNTLKIVTTTYNCGNCGFTVRSEDMEAVEEAGDSEAEDTA